MGKPLSASIVLREEGAGVPAAGRTGPPAPPLTLLVERAVHEMRTPLNAVLGWASMLRTHRLDEAAQARAVEAIERSARAEARILDELVQAARALAGEVELCLAAVDLSATVAAAVEAVRPDAEAGQVALSTALDAGGSPVAADADLLGKVLRELIANAVRATPRGGTVTVRLASAGTTTEIAVRDTGCGIAAERLPFLFDGPFAGARARENRRGRLGAGLVVARHLVEAHGGTIDAESAGKDRGATFTVRLPTLPGEPGSALSARAPPLAAAGGRCDDAPPRVQRPRSVRP
jgi:signal transduction histidine kinase